MDDIQRKLDRLEELGLCEPDEVGSVLSINIDWVTNGLRVAL